MDSPLFPYGGQEITNHCFKLQNNHLNCRERIFSSTYLTERPGLGKLEKLRKWVERKPRWGFVEVIKMRLMRDKLGIIHFLQSD